MMLSCIVIAMQHCSWASVVGLVLLVSKVKREHGPYYWSRKASGVGLARSCQKDTGLVGTKRRRGLACPTRGKRTSCRSEYVISRSAALLIAAVGVRFFSTCVSSERQPHCRVIARLIFLFFFLFCVYGSRHRGLGVDECFCFTCVACRLSEFN